MNWPVALLATLAIELPLAWLLGPSQVRRRLVGDALLANLWTHPLVWLWVGAGGSWWAAEAGALVAEGVVYWLSTGLPPQRAALVAAVANGATALASFCV
jgi:hypothetical protein